MSAGACADWPAVGSCRDGRVAPRRARLRAPNHKSSGVQRHQRAQLVGVEELTEDCVVRMHRRCLRAGATAGNPQKSLPVAVPWCIGNEDPTPTRWPTGALEGSRQKMDFSFSAAVCAISSAIPSNLTAEGCLECRPRTVVRPPSQTSLQGQVTGVARDRGERRMGAVTPGEPLGTVP